MPEPDFSQRFTNKIKVYLWLIYGIAALVFCTIFGVSSAIVESDRIGSVLAGLAVGSFGASLNFFFGWRDYAEKQRIHNIGIYDIVDHRDDFIYYEKLIKSSKKEIKLLANTANRFLSDFADHSRPDRSALINAMRGGVKFEILVPHSEYIQNDEVENLNRSMDILRKLKSDFPSTIEYKIYKRYPAHSVFVVDNDCIFGPLFSGFMKSRNLPSLKTRTYSLIGSVYLRYFERLWQESDEDNC